MVESFRVNAVLNFTSNSPQVLQQLGREFGQFDRVIKDGQSSLRAFENTLKGIGSGRNLSALVRNLEQLGRVRVGNIQGLGSLGQAATAIERLSASGGGGITKLVNGLEKLGKLNLGGAPSEINTLVRLLENIVNVQQRVLTGARAIGTAWKETATAMKEGADALKGIRTTPPSAPRQYQPQSGVLTPAERQQERDWVGAGMAAGMIEQAIRSPIEKAFQAAMETRERTALLGIAGFTAADMAAAKANAYRVQTEVPSAMVAGNLEITKDLYAVLRDVKEATSFTEDLARIGVILGKEGKGDQIGELFKLAQAGELRGALSAPGSDEIDPERFKKFLLSAEMLTVGTGGRVGPTDLLSVLRQSGIAGVRASDEALFQSFPAVIMAMKAMRFGTALQSLQQSEFGHLAKGYGEEQARIGLIEPGMLQSLGKGQGSRILPGGLANEQEAMTNFPHWVFSTLMPKLDKFVDPKNSMTSADRLNASMRELYSIFPRNTITRMVEDIMRNRALIEKEERGLNPVTGPMAGKNFLAELMANDPKLHLEQFNAAWAAFLSSWGEASMGSVVKYLDLMTNGLNAMAAWARANPTMAAKITEVAIALGVLAGAVSALSLASVVLGPGGRILKSLAVGGGAAGAAASAGGGAVAASAAGSGGALGLLTNPVTGLPIAAIGGAALGASYDMPTMTDTGEIIGGWNPGNRGAPGGFTLPPPPGSSPSNPVFNMQLNQPSGKDIANGVADNQARTLASPSSGTTWANPLSTPQLTPTPW